MAILLAVHSAGAEAALKINGDQPAKTAEEILQMVEEAAEDYIRDQGIEDELRGEIIREEKDDPFGMAAIMIGKRKRIIVMARGLMIVAMLNPKILSRTEEYEAEEGCLSLEGTRKVRRYRSIRLSWQDVQMKQHIGILDGFQAQIVQHEVDHCNGILI